MSDFITCENKDLYSWEALIKQTIGQDADGEFYWKVKAVLGDDYYFFDDFEQVASGGIDSANLPDPQSLQDFRWDTSVTNFTVLLVEQADPFFGVMRLISGGAGSGAATWGGSNFNGGWYKSMKTRFQIHTANLATDNFMIGWQGNANDYFYIGDGLADNNLHIISNNNGVHGDDDTGVAFASDTIYTIELRMEGTAIAAILNGVTVPLVNCNVRDLNIFHPIYYYRTNADNNYMDVDYIRLYQERG